jgi:hypothetical protein
MKSQLVDAGRAAELGIGSGQYRSRLADSLVDSRSRVARCRLAKDDLNLVSHAFGRRERAWCRSSSTTQESWGPASAPRLLMYGMPAAQLPALRLDGAQTEEFLPSAIDIMLNGLLA